MYFRIGKRIVISEDQEEIGDFNKRLVSKYEIGERKDRIRTS